jgi:hypothetical protein
VNVALGLAVFCGLMLLGLRANGPILDRSVDGREVGRWLGLTTLVGLAALVAWILLLGISAVLG